MPTYEAARIAAFIEICTDQSHTSAVRGRAFEDLFCYLLNAVTGLRTVRNKINKYKSEEIDVAVANTRFESELACFPHLFLVECKNWSKPVDSPTIGAFLDKLENRGIDLGVLVVANGVTGDPDEMSAAYHKAALALGKGRRLVVVMLEDLIKVGAPEDLANLLVERLLGLIASGTFQLS